MQSHAGLANLTGNIAQRLGVRALGHRDVMGQVLIRLRNGVLSLVALLLLSAGAAAQEGCYFGVCPGDPGTEFPTTPTVQLPPSVSLPAPVPTSAPSPGTTTPPAQSKAPGGKTKGGAPPRVQSEAELLCLRAYFRGGDFVWDPAMTVRNAMATCEAALRANPDSQDLQFYYAATRDVWGAWGEGGSPADDYYAVTAYRDLAAKGYAMAEYALGTMYDEAAGVSQEEGWAIQRRSAEGEFGLSASCQTLAALYIAGDLENAGVKFDMGDMERRARDSASCAHELLIIYSHSSGEFSVSLPFEAYARSAATSGSGWGMYFLGVFYTQGAVFGWSSSTRAPVNLERGGLWLVLHHWWRMQRADMAGEQAEWIEDTSNLEDVFAIQTALKSLGFYNGVIDGDFGPASRAALDAFLAADVVDRVFQRIRSEEQLSPLLPPLAAIHLGDAALTAPP